MARQRDRPSPPRPTAQHLPFLTLILLLLIAFYAFHGPVRAWLSGRYRTVRRFDEALGVILDEYVDPVEPRDVLEGAVKGMVKALRDSPKYRDRHSRYLPPPANRRAEEAEAGKYGGVGIRLWPYPYEGKAYIHEVLRASPAHDGGLRAGDAILAAAGHDLTGLENIERVVQLIRGKVGTTVRLRIARAAKQFDVSLTRRQIPRPVVEPRRYGDGIGYLRIFEFPDGAAEKVKAALEGLCEKHIQSLVLDLRWNNGGFLDEAVVVADLFVAEGEIVSTRGRHAHDHRTHRAKAGDGGEHLAIVCLVNQFTASAAEVVAGSLQDHQRARLVGTRTFGKGVVSKRFPLRGGGGLMIITGRYYLPSGAQIEGEGLRPDIEHELPPPTKEQIAALRPGDRLPDPQLEAALRLLRGGPASTPPAPASPKGAPPARSEAKPSR